MIFLRAAFRFGASVERSRTNLALPPSQSSSASCSNKRSWDAILGPVMMKPAGILFLEALA
jgi:hypothetical protein